MKLFVTGGTGFVGGHFLRQALQNGHEVRALRRPGSRPRVCLTAQPAWVDSNMEDLPGSEIAGVDAVVHLAAHSANVPYDSLENCLLHNVMAPLRLFRTGMAVGVTRFVVAGSCFEYGRSGERFEFIPADAPLEPTQTYPASKAAASLAFSQLARQYGLRLSIHRIFQVYGEGEAEDRLWPSLVKAAVEGRDFAMTPAEQVRDFITVEAAAAQLLAALQLEVQPGEPLFRQVGSGCPQTLRSFAESVWREHKATGNLLFGSKPYRPGEVMRYVPKL